MGATHPVEPVLAGCAQVRWTGVADGDLRMSSPGAAARRRQVVDLPWATLDQVHGSAVHVVASPADVDGAAGDALVSAVPGLALAVLTADCAPVALASAEGIVAVAHAGWRGLVAGVVPATVEAMRALGATRIEAAVGPCIEAACYEFGEPELAMVAAVCGPQVRASDAAGRPALDLAAGVAAALRKCGAVLVASADACTACGGSWWSWRARQDLGRQATVIWRDAA